MSTQTTKEKILQQLAENPVIIYMKGVPSAPECGFSAKAVGILNETKVPFTYVNVMKAPFIRERLPSVSKWPTFPQLFINGELIGGADIVESMYNDGSLLPLLQAAVTPADPVAASQTITHSEVEALILSAYPGAKIEIEGQGCDLGIVVVSELFAGQTMIKQHQGVMETLSEPLASGRLHAVTLKTFTPEQQAAQQPAANPGLLQIQL
ncbi:Grx4 family monothiol glutaredoxin [Methylomonas sp. MED-D]|uniref:Glutaredoxin n=1 Tax=Methylomonas koyamae TaxID=702114 RepID=A0A177N583_9GAMM|nr:MULTISPECIES: Grx4 family monothiol glutaredoxin [Methylomonas]NJA05636.1 Grx4 family monothiol glutaredoxin [Methylococcaceae bacterium WWC4]OAI13156.1 glutaredoxin [Methylomonas koyamae]WGS86677.1 Grx4 family monothiol glutaredoxin [Methylomonas sp. UP202]